MDSIGVKIVRASSTRAGDLLLAVEKKGPGSAQALKQEILKHMGEEQGVVVRDGKRDGAVLHVKGLDAATTAAEVLNAVAEAAGEPRGKCKVVALRPAFGDTQNGTILASKRIIRRLLEIGTVQIGWVRCRMVERVEIGRCLKCWTVGHTVPTCPKDVNRRKACLRCAQEGHLVKDCKGEPFCPICNKGGHRADSKNCPVYKEATEGPARNRRRKSRDGSGQDLGGYAEALPPREVKSGTAEEVDSEHQDPRNTYVNVAVEGGDSRL